MDALALGIDKVSLSTLRHIDAARQYSLRLSDVVAVRVAKGEALVRERVDRGETVYGVNTGVGPLAGTVIDPEQLEDLQLRLILSNAAGVGDPLPETVVRRAILLKLLSLSSGHCGVSLNLVNTLMEWFNRRMTPVVPSKGSVGASGDLAPLAHLAAAFCGIGEVQVAGVRLDASKAIEQAGLKPLKPGLKEGAALLNGTEISTALGIEGLFRVEDCFGAAMVTASMMIDAGGGTADALDPRIQISRGQRGQTAVAAASSALLKDSALQKGARARIQDPYCLRCHPQVAGAALDVIGHASEVLAREIGAVTDNPLVCLDSGDLLYGGNFHAQPIGLAADSLAMAICEIGGISERRVAYMMDSNYSGLPPFLVAEGGLNSGFMLGQVTAAALVSENRSLATPYSVDSIPTGANSEDYVSMATGAARRLLDMTANLRSIIAIEMLAACQGIDLRRPAQTSAKLESVWSAVRDRVDAWDRDRLFAPDINAVVSMIEGRDFLMPEVTGLLPSFND